MSNSKRYLGSLYLALAAGIWGGTYVVSKIVLEVIPPFELVWIRYLIASVTLVVMGLVSRQSWKIRKQDIPLVLAIGLIGYLLSITAQFIGTKLSSAQMGAVITSATPAFMVVFARFLLQEKVNWRKGLSVCLATVGVLLIVFGNGSDAQSGFGSGILLGGAILFLAALTWALMSVLVKRVPSDYPQVVITTYAILVAFVFMSPYSLYQLSSFDFHPVFEPSVIFGLLYLGTVSTAGAFLLWNQGLQMVEAGSGGLYFFFQPLVGTMLGWLILGEQVGFLFWVGSFLILSGVLFVIRE
ncbi:DMT family transporter [Tumebacillus sp. ITR2]|uniref:DMT family transporter n=1 Tax=Tumebacillus amylolyticus TaxID=2801339 RepID=A0ABS1J957_9BACL|nr:DMT family transporter [Tumebacillus amylolyticus]MBL0386797.1 DMT family transporter [Tumebacillus amylolyticus]